MLRIGIHWKWWLSTTPEVLTMSIISQLLTQTEVLFVFISHFGYQWIPFSGTVSPLEEGRPLTYQSLTVIVPTTCSVIVLTVIIIVGCFVVNKRRPMSQQNGCQTPNSVHNCTDDSLSDAFHLQFWSHEKTVSALTPTMNRTVRRPALKKRYTFSRRTLCLDFRDKCVSSLICVHSKTLYATPDPNTSIKCHFIPNGSDLQITFSVKSVGIPEDCHIKCQITKILYLLCF